MRDLADGAVLLDLDQPQGLAASLIEARPDGFLDAIPGARTLLVLFDPARFDRTILREPPPLRPAAPPRTITLPAIYDGPDLAQVASALGAAPGDVVRRHLEAEHRVAFLGFWPGFAYMTGGFAVPRLTTPRVRVPAGSLAVADGYTAVYPVESPGGWRLIGRVAARLFEPWRPRPALLDPGDRVVFEAVKDLPPLPPPPAPPKREPVLRVVSPGPYTTVQGAPRFGLGRHGVGAGGAMDLAALAEANAAVGNPPGAAALEYTLAGPEIEMLRGPRAGERLRAPPLKDGVRGYLAIEGGLALPLPGEPGRPLRAGEELALAEQPPGPSRTPPPPATPREVRALRGPQWDFFAAPERFFGAEWTVSPESDRRGLRLRGPALHLARPPDIPPEGTAPGSVQVPGDGQPIALGPDRPVTGGYAKIATVIWADLPLLAQARPGARLQFREVTLGEAMEALR